MSKRKRIFGYLLTISLLSTIPVLSTTIKVNANSGIEEEFKSVISKYDEKNLIIENGVSLKRGESLDLSKYPKWELSNNSTVAIDDNGILKSLNEGTVFLSQQIGEKVHIVEVYVAKPEIKLFSSAKSYKSTKTNRNYYKVFVDPGHGGDDNGATGFGKNEDVLNLEVANRVTSKLQAKGIEVKMSRTTDIYLTLSERARLANKYGADVFVSVHQNSASTASANGIETYHHINKTNHKPLSTDIQNNTIKETGSKSRGVKSANFGVLRESNMPSALFESGFISNIEEYNKLSDPAYQEKLASGIANGIETYLRDNIQLGEDNQKPVDPPPVYEVIDTGVVTATSLNIREGYGTEYSVIGTLPRGSKVEIVESQNGWYKIKYNGTYGCVDKRYIQIDIEEPSIPEIPETPTPEFIDIQSHWAKANIIDFASKGYIGGYDDNTFKPDNNITRAEFVKIVNKVFGLSEKRDIYFEDIDESAWYYSDVCIGVSAGYIKGYEDNTFRPNEAITRQEAANIVASVTNLFGDGVLEFNDKDEIAPWAKDSVDALNDNKIMGGYEDNTFKPKNKITRAEAVSTLSRVAK